MRAFPIYRLNEAITKSMEKIVSLDISQGINDGLDSMIHFVDEEGGPISTIAEITEKNLLLNPDEPKRYVKISVAYAQMLWMICSIVLRNHDSIAIESEIERMTPEERNRYYKELKKDHSKTSYQRELIDKKNTFAISAEMLNVMEYMMQRNITEDEMDFLYEFDMESEIGTRVNSLYVYAMTFILLHEFSHHSLNHDFSHEGSFEEEEEADHSAFFFFFSDLEGKERKTALLGVLCSLVSLIFVNTPLIDDGIHPLPIERIFYFYDQVKDEDSKFAGIMCHLFYSWAVYVHDSNMPQWDAPYNETLNKIRVYMLEKEYQANNLLR